MLLHLGQWVDNLSETMTGRQNKHTNTERKRNCLLACSKTKTYRGTCSLNYRNKNKSLTWKTPRSLEPNNVDSNHLRSQVKNLKSKCHTY